MEKHEDIKLENLNKNFEFARFCSELDNVDDVDDLKSISKMYFKLYLKQQEVLSDLGFDK
jgi:hypothetical protein